MYSRFVAWIKRRKAQAREHYLARLKATEKEHYREFLECNEVARDLGRMERHARAFARSRFESAGEDDPRGLEAQQEARTYKQQAQEEYEAADFHYAAYIEARERCREATNT